MSCSPALPANEEIEGFGIVVINEEAGVTPAAENPLAASDQSLPKKMEVWSEEYK